MKEAIWIRMAVEGGAVVEMFMNNTLRTLAVEEEDASVAVVELAAAVEDAVVVEDGVVVEDRVVVEVEEFVVKRLVAIRKSKSRSINCNNQQYCRWRQQYKQKKQWT